MTEKTNKALNTPLSSSKLYIPLLFSSLLSLFCFLLLLYLIPSFPFAVVSVVFLLQVLSWAKCDLCWWELCWVRYDERYPSLSGEFRADKNNIIWMPLGGQANTLKGKQTEAAWAEAVFGSSGSCWGLGRKRQICRSRCMMKVMVNGVCVYGWCIITANNFKKALSYDATLGPSVCGLLNL